MTEGRGGATSDSGVEGPANAPSNPAEEEPAGPATLAEQRSSTDGGPASSGRFPPTARGRLRRLAPLVLIAGLAAAAAMGRGALPAARIVTVRLEGERADVRQVTLVVTDVADGEEERSSTRWHFEHGAPASLRRDVRLPAGTYHFSVEVVTTEGKQAKTDRIGQVTSDGVTIKAGTH